MSEEDEGGLIKINKIAPAGEARRVFIPSSLAKMVELRSRFTQFSPYGDAALHRTYIARVSRPSRLSDPWGCELNLSNKKTRQW